MRGQKMVSDAGRDPGEIQQVIDRPNWVGLPSPY